jgi:hypothetical protein
MKGGRDLIGNMKEQEEMQKKILQNAYFGGIKVGFAFGLSIGIIAIEVIIHLFPH